MSRIEEEKRVVEQMIRLYCRKCEGHDELCPSCKELLDYAHSRLERCRYGEQKPTCKKCPVHCYRPDMKERIRMVMRWSGPRMIIYHPIAAIQHLIREIIARRKDCWMWWLPSFLYPPPKSNYRVCPWHFSKAVSVCYKTWFKQKSFRLYKNCRNWVTIRTIAYCKVCKKCCIFAAIIVAS